MYTRLYIHIPFCSRKCPYCAFFSQEISFGDLERYTGLLLREMSRAAAGSPPGGRIDSVYFGGGTPSLMEPGQIAALLGQVQALFNPAPDAEVTLEANPGTVDREKLEGFRQAGVTRLSLGVQSFDDGMLSSLGRIHSAQQAREAFQAARHAGFDNIGIDLIHALPGQTLVMWQTELQQALSLSPDHISVYGLTVEEDTPFAALHPGQSRLLPDEDLAAEMFETADDILTGAGYEHYEIANYALSGCRSRHNSGYWRRDGYLGLGAGAHSFLLDSGHGVRFSNPVDLEAYAQAVKSGCRPHTDITRLSRDDAMAEFIFLGLRMSDGVRFSSFEQEFGVGFQDAYRYNISALLSQGLLQEDNAAIRLTRRGMLLSNLVFRQFLP
jgi:oxygen-independent coproporphyrinogen-3 oxidase